MKLTKSHLVVAGTVVGGGLVIYIAASLVSALSSPKDTPIVLGGGSIYGDTHFLDTDGWNRQPGYYSGSIHPGHYNPNGIDSLTLSGFDNNPGNSISGTGGWAISVWNVDSNNNPKDGALRLCSDANCSASHKQMDGSDNPSPCNGLSPLGVSVYVGVRSDSGLEERKALGGLSKAIREVRFYDGACDGQSGTESSCDTINKITLETCRPVSTNPLPSPPPPPPYSTDYTCANKKGKCSVQVGHWFFN
jgi:hypothetical protein